MNKETLGKTMVVGVVIIGLIVAAVAFKGKESADLSSGTMPRMNDSMSDKAPSSSDIMETNKIIYKNFDVEPSTIRVKKGTTVTWTNEDDAKHDVTPTTQTEDFKASELFGKGETYSFTFNTVGTYSYMCSPHPYMKGTIEVVES